MAENYYSDNPDIRFHLHNLGLGEIVGVRESDYADAAAYPDAPESYDDAVDSYDRVLEMLGEICAEHIAPRARDVDLEGCHLDGGVVEYASGTKENLRDLTRAQAMGVMIPRRYGGLNFPVTVYTMMNEMVSRADGSLQNLFGLQDIAETIFLFGDEDQRQRFLPRFAAGEVDGAMALTEPDAGSDLQAVQLRARLDPGANVWHLNGMKRFITNGCAQVLLVLARSEEGTKDGRGLSMFVCERCPQLVVRRIEDKFGIHGSPTCELQFNDVPAELVGKRRFGLTRYVMSLMNGARVAIASQALGIAEAAYREALDYARAREQFGKSIDRFPAVYEMLVSARVQIAATRAFLYETTKYVDLRDVYEHWVPELPESQRPADARSKAKTYTRIAAELTPLAKAMATEMANKVAYDGVQIHGGTGYMRDFNAERFSRDARITNIYEGTTQLQYVAGIGGVMRRTLEPLMNELSQLQYEGRLRRLASRVDMGREKLQQATRFVADRNDSEYFDLCAGRLCRMETAVLASYLLLRDSLVDRKRDVLAERYIMDSMPVLDMDHACVTSGDVSLIDRHEEVLAL